MSVWFLCSIRSPLACPAALSSIAFIRFHVLLYSCAHFRAQFASPFFPPIQSKAEAESQKPAEIHAHFVWICFHLAAACVYSVSLPLVSSTRTHLTRSPYLVQYEISFSDSFCFVCNERRARDRNVFAKVFIRLFIICYFYFVQILFCSPLYFSFSFEKQILRKEHFVSLLREEKRNA